MLLRQAYYRVAPLADARTHLAPIDAIRQLMDNPSALPSSLDGRHCLVEISVIQGTHVLAQLPPRIVLPAGDEIRCSRDAFPQYPDPFPAGAFLLVKIVLLDGHMQ